jgi:nucleoside 2-deoxyribosyltransferase
MAFPPPYAGWRKVRMKIYLAGPLFNTAEREFNSTLAELLRSHNHEIWLPQEHEQRNKTAKQVFDKDVEGIDWADVVVANMDGADPDSGTCWECGYAYKKKPVIVFRTDFRAGDEPDKGPYNLMLTMSATQQVYQPFVNAEALAARVLEALDRIPLTSHGKAPA